MVCPSLWDNSVFNVHRQNFCIATSSDCVIILPFRLWLFVLSFNKEYSGVKWKNSKAYTLIHPLPFSLKAMCIYTIFTYEDL